MKHIAVIPARSGSKGLPHKNIKPLDGKPLMIYSIEAALQSGLFDTVHVSTDSEEYAAIGRENGADVPFLRSPELSGDHASTWDAMRFVLKEYACRGLSFDTLTLLQPTSPLRDAGDIKSAFDFFQVKDADMISSVCEMEHSPLWSNTLPEDFSMAHFEREEYADVPRQMLPVYYRENGAIYILKTSFLLSGRPMYGEKSYAFLMRPEHSIDIDSTLDFHLAETLLHVTEG